MMLLTFSKRGLVRFWFASMVLSVLFLASTAWAHSVFYSSDDLSARKAYILGLFALSQENTIASWHSAMLLFGAGMVALLCYWTENSGQRVRSRAFFSHGWLFIACLFSLLSLDEMGSLHESAGRLSMLDVVGDNSWQSVVAVPGVLVVAYMLGFGWMCLRQYTVALSLLALGCVLFLSVPVQEHFEMTMWAEAGYSEQWQRPIGFILLEEGAELFGSLCFLGGMVSYIRLSGGRTSVIQVQKSSARIVMVIAILFALALAISFLLLIFSPVIASDTGIAHNWLPASAIMLLMFYAIGRNTKDSIIISVAMAILSAFFGSNLYSVLDWSEISMVRYVIMPVIFLATAIVSRHLFAGETNMLTRAFVFAWAILIVWSLFSSSVFPAFLVSSLTVILLCAKIRFSGNLVASSSSAG